MPLPRRSIEHHGRPSLGCHCRAVGHRVVGLGPLYQPTRENSLAQVFFPNAVLFVAMACFLPLVWVPMQASDLGWILLYSFLAFAGRWIIVLAFGLLPAYVATPLMNLQFVWMVAIGFVAFGEVPEAGTVIGVLLVICSSLWLVRDEMLPGKAATT